MDDKFFQYPDQILREDHLDLFTQSPFLPVHFHWTTTPQCRDPSRGAPPHPKKVDTKTNEITCVRPLLDEIEIAGKVITADALLTQKAIAEYLVEERGAAFVFTVKENQPTLKRVIEALNLTARRCDDETTDKGHGRITTRRIWCDDSLKGSVPFPHVQQVFCIEREVTHLKKGITTVDIVYGVTSQSKEQAGPKTILSQNRKHWSVENKQHDVLDVTFDEDRSQIRRLNGPMVMTCLRRAAISLLRIQGMTNIAQACRWLWAKPHVAIRMVLP
jgi:predicted transposase YbfD/YdcC